MVTDDANQVGPEHPPFPTGASTFANPQMAPLSGHYHRLPAGTTLPPELGVIADGCDVMPDSVHGATHHTIYPSVKISAELFIQLFLSLPWQYGRKKQ